MSKFNVFEKKNLRTGDLAKTRDGAWHVVMLNTREYGDKGTTNILVDYYSGDFLRLEKYTDNLLHNSGDEKFTIDTIAVTTVPHLFIKGLINKSLVEQLLGFKIIWEREIPEVTRVKNIIADLESKLQEAQGELKKINTR